MPENEKAKKEQIAVRLAMTESMILLNYPEDSLDILRNGERLAQEVGDPKSKITLTDRLSMYHTLKGDMLQAIRYAEEAFNAAEKLGDIDLMGRIGPDPVIAYLIYGDAETAVYFASRVIHLLEKNRKENEFFEISINTYVFMQALYGHSLALLGRFKEAETACEKALSFARSLDHPASIAYAEFPYSMMLGIKGDGKNAIKHAETALIYFKGVEITIFLPFSLTSLGWGYYLVDELETARNHMEKALQFSRDMGIQFLMSETYCKLGMIHLGLGEVEKAQEYVEKALNSARNSNSKFFESLAWTWLGHILGKKEPPEFERAEEYILKGIKMGEELKLRPFYSQGYLALGELHTDMGQLDEARKNLEKAEENFRDMEMDYYLKKTQEVLTRLK
jgi:tetratricopeptide (TPR) repeat protein